MKVKLDENLAGSAAPIFAEAGHDVDTDRGFGDIQRYPPGGHAGILVLRVDDQSTTSVRDTLRALVDFVDLDALAGCVAVYHEGNLRVRRPSDT